MRRPFFFTTLVLLCTVSIAYGNPVGKSAEEQPASAAPPLARVRIIHQGMTRVSRYASSLALGTRAATVAAGVLPVVDQPDIEEDDRILLDKIFRALPALCRENLEHVIVRYDPSAERGQATATTMLLRGPLWNLSAKKKMEMIGVITHECGHIMSLNALAGLASDGMSNYPDGHIPTYNGPAARFYSISWKNAEEMRKGAKSGDFVSGYAKENPFEDIAETITYYLLQRAAFEERAESNSILALKLQWAETSIDDPLFRAPLSSTNWDRRIPWDVTKLAHALAL